MRKKQLITEREFAEAQGETLVTHDHIVAALRKMTDDPGRFFDGCVEQARKGDAWAAREVLHSFCLCFEKSLPIPYSVQRHLWLAFSKYLVANNSVPLEKALGLVAPAHRKKGSRNKKGKENNDTNPLQLVAHVHLLVKRDGLRKGEAVQKTSEQFNVSKRAVEGYNKDWNLVRDYSVAELERLAQPVAESPFRK